MSEMQLETRVGIIEHQIKSLLEIHTQVRETHEKVFELGVMLEAQKKLPICPAPGTCIALVERVNALETKASEARGGWRVVAAISAVVTGALAWLWNHFVNTKHP